MEFDAAAGRRTFQSVDSWDARGYHCSSLDPTLPFSYHPVDWGEPLDLSLQAIPPFKVQ